MCISSRLSTGAKRTQLTKFHTHSYNILCGENGERQSVFKYLNNVLYLFIYWLKIINSVFRSLKVTSVTFAGY